MTLALAAAGCGGGSHPGTPTRAAGPPGKCSLSAKQRREVAAARREIVRMRRLERPLETVHETGPPALENAVNRFLLDVGPLPSDIKGQLMDQGKAASALCHDCFNAIEAEEPVAQTRLGHSPCAAR
ncbi:MAG: hypothetical protein ACJ75G_04555 [Gaiellaceae bacterium]